MAIYILICICCLVLQTRSGVKTVLV